MSPENQIGYYRPFEAIERAITQKAELARSFPQQIGIDGLSAVGKGTLANRLADLLHVPYFNTGMVYRAITTAILQDRTPIDTVNDDQLGKMLRNINVFYPGSLGSSHIDIETPNHRKKDITGLTQTAYIENAVSAIAGRLPTRQKVEAIQEKFLQDNPACVIEGRNMREVLKKVPSENKFLLYVYASPEELAKRLQNRRNESYDIAKDSVLTRIRSDYNRAHGRVYPPYEANMSGDYHLVIDSTFLQHSEVVLTTLTALTQKIQTQEVGLRTSAPTAAAPVR